MKNPARSRPAETSGGLVGLATAAAALSGASTTVVAIVGTLAGVTPAAVSWLVSHGGIRGAARTLWRGR